MGDTFIFSIFTFDFPSPQNFIASYFILRSGKGKEYMPAADSGNILSSVFEPILFFLLLFQGFDLMDSCQLLHERHISSADTPIHGVCSILISRNLVKDYILCAYRVVGSICHQ